MPHLRPLWAALLALGLPLAAKQYSYSCILRVLDGPNGTAPASPTSSTRQLPATDPKTHE